MNIYYISLSNLRRRKMRMLFLVLGLTIAVSTVVTLVTVSEASNADIASTLDEFGANILILPKSEVLSLNYGGMPVSGVAMNVQRLSQHDARKIATIKNNKNIRIIAPKLLNVASVAQHTVMIVGVEFPQELQLKKWWKLSGSRLPGDRGAVVGAEVQSTLHLGLNDTLRINGEWFTVAGVLEPTGSQDDEVVFIDLSTAQTLFDAPEQLSMVEVAALCYDCPIEEIVRQTSEKLPGAKVVAIRQTIESKMEALHRFEHFWYGISAVMVLVAALIVMTTMTASVNERRREIGIFRAIGFRQKHIMLVILTEAFLTSALAGLMGFAVGLGASRLVVPLLTLKAGGALTVDYALLGLSTGLSVSIGLLSSILPAYRASRLDPTVALKAL